jgi:2-polyprenyl-3-methyl-5-hydroxy-6-metoxy-1,4-benzoquinol methylase
MLAAAGFLTLDLAAECLGHGWRLKDATPANVLFRGPSPVFVDVLSFERADPSEPIWPAYAQFVRTFLLPLLTGRSPWLTHRDGISPREAYQALSWWKRLTLPGLLLASLPAWMARRAESDGELYRPRRTNPERAVFTLRNTFSQLRRQVGSVAGRARDSEWSGYLGTQQHYSAAQFAAKERFVAEALEEFQPRRVLDVGANTGHFSEVAARAGASVVAIDADAAAVGRIWKRAKQGALDILPLVVDFCRPTPAVGWRNREWPSFLERARGGFDMTMMLAVAHHLLVTERVPLEEMLDLAAELTNDLLLIEYVAPDDPMFRRLVRGRGALYAHLTTSHFDAAVRSRFRLVRKKLLPGSSRTLYLLRKDD